MRSHRESGKFHGFHNWRLRNLREEMVQIAMRKLERA